MKEVKGIVNYTSSGAICYIDTLTYVVQVAASIPGFW
jgi:hypothetical protein